MNTCNTCKHWLYEGEEWQKFGVDRGRCQCPKISDELYEREMGDGAMPLPLYEDGACFDTGPRFGCIHHEEKI